MIFVEKEYFLFKKIDPKDQQAMEQIYRLRFEVYCHECGFIEEKDYPDGRETDEYDKQSVHFAAINSFGEIIGTVRLILSTPLVLPIKKYCPDVRLEPEVSYAEISRLVISKRLRRRANDQLY